MTFQFLADAVMKFGLGTVAIVCLMYIVIFLLKYIVKDLSGKIDTLYEIINDLRKKLEEKE